MYALSRDIDDIAALRQALRRDEDDEVALRRAQSRLSQQRYRLQKRRALELREKEVQELRCQVARFQGQLDIMRATVRVHESELQVANEYFRVFRHSFQKSLPSYSRYQCDFLRSVMQPDVQFMGQVGIDKIFEQWRLYHSLFQSFTMTCPSLDIINLDEGAVVRAPATMHLRISRTTIEALYPHILHDERIVQKLVGQVLHLPILIHFHYDARSRIRELETSANMTSSLADLLESLDDTLFVLNGAHWNANAEIVIMFTTGLTEYERAEAKKALRRKQVRVNQQRYRMRLMHANTVRTRDVAALGREIARYQGQLDVLRNAVCFYDAEAKTAVEYFELFRHGYCLNSPALRQTQEAFVGSSMSSNLFFLGENNVEKLWEQWRLSHVLFPTYAIDRPQIEHVSVEDTTIVRVATTLHLGISRKTLEALFPQVLANEHLVAQMIGRVLHLPVVIHLHYDAWRRIVRIETTASVAVGLANLLATSEDTLAALEGGRLTANAGLDVKPRQLIRSPLDKLETDVEALRHHIARCEGQLEVLRASVPLHEPQVAVAAEFFRIFRYGYQMHQPSYRHQQDSFLCSVMQPDLAFMGERGIAKLFAQWQLYYELFASFDMELPEFQVLVGDSNVVVRAPAVLQLRISRATIEALYPHVLQNEFLVQRMVGQVLEMSVLMHFHFDDNNMVVQLDTVADIVAGLHRVVGSLQDTLSVLTGARIKNTAEIDTLCKS
ncbi:hypothetical protein ACHHYP_09153 [Achlya hypogyna]|uniref:Bzip transcription factor n=1 Tax=Achlya hypogyna TaxID=1202772 RepID=A0A1V9ZJW0_ACHHY|nr:hypothetical protein ACHHYP_09153 [Achlya hypogyna]